MTGTVHAEPALIAQGLRKVFEHQDGAAVCALDAVSLEAEQGALTALVGPTAPARPPSSALSPGFCRRRGMLRVLDIDVAADPQQVQDRIGYMPQRFGSTKI